MVRESHDGSHVSDEELSEEVLQDPARVFYSQAAAYTFANAFTNQIVSRGSQARAAATQNLVELSCCKLKKIYALCENFIYTGWPPVLLPGLTGSNQVRSGRT